MDNDGAKRGPPVIFNIGEGAAAEKFMVPRDVVNKNNVLQAMFGPHFKEGQSCEVTLEDVTPESFRVLLEYLSARTISTEIDSGTLVDLLGLAKMYLEEELLHRCRVVLQIQLYRNCDEMLACLNKLENMEEQDLYRCLLGIIKDDADNALEAADDVLELSEASLTELLKADRISVQEKELWDTLYGWARARLQEQRKPVTSVSLREVMGEKLFMLRPLRMTAKEFYEGPGDEVLQPLERDAVSRMRYKVILNQEPFDQFTYKQRSGVLIYDIKVDCGVFDSTKRLVGTFPVFKMLIRRDLMEKHGLLFKVLWGSEVLKGWEGITDTGFLVTHTDGLFAMRFGAVRQGEMFQLEGGYLMKGQHFPAEESPLVFGPGMIALGTREISGTDGTTKFEYLLYFCFNMGTPLPENATTIGCIHSGWSEVKKAWGLMTAEGLKYLRPGLELRLYNMGYDF